ncbi:hypothetical protein ASC84_19805 [Acinetobacter sp. Root1280]|uniref:hypothetical protein n=1 Tax=Acinetobacter sp. Root1280 TaxID=1736444 RepID=UPI0006FB405E|nr:hypothetical protein [Acinetobacter sp. Root1280]KQW99739.1 hypothetical protein ASC84_19805 [Acinetobacter sp. Root1280]
MVKRAFLKFIVDVNGKLAITGDTPNGEKIIFNIPIDDRNEGLDLIFPCYYDGKVYVFYQVEGGAAYSIYDGGSLSHHIRIPEFGDRKLLTAVSVTEGLVVFSRLKNSLNQGFSSYQIIKLQNGKWGNYEDISSLELFDGAEAEQACGATVNGEARIVRPVNTYRGQLQFLSSSDNFQIPFSLICDGQSIMTRTAVGYAISAELSSFNYIYALLEGGSDAGIAIYLQESKTYIRKLGKIKLPALSTIEGLSIHRISMRKFFIYIVGISGSQRQAYSGEFDINNLESEVKPDSDVGNSLPKYLSAWIINN